MTDVEKLAREICWAGFHFPPKGGKIKYWARVGPNARASYIETAKEFLWIANKLGADKINTFVPHRVPESQTKGREDESTRRQPA